MGFAMYALRRIFVPAFLVLLCVFAAPRAHAAPTTAPATSKPQAAPTTRKTPQARDVELPKDGREKPLPMGAGLKKTKATSRPSKSAAPAKRSAAPAKRGTVPAISSPSAAASKSPFLPPASDTSPRDGVDWWRVGFFSSVAVLAGLGLTLVTNLVRVADFEDRKEAILASYAPGDPRRAGGCDAAVAGSELDTVCESGTRAATLGNVLVAVTVGTAVVSGLLAYKAFFSARETKRRAAVTTRVALESVDAAVLPSGGALNLRFRF